LPSPRHFCSSFFLYAEGTTIVGEPGGDAFVAAFDEQGAGLWMTKLGGPGLELGSGVAKAGDGVVVTGWFEQAAEFGDYAATSAGSLDGFIVRLAR
jgi:hypothetical protein